MGRSGLCSFEEEGFKAWQELCMEAGRDAHPGEAAEGQRQRLWVAVAWVVGAEVRAVQGQRKQEGVRQAPGPRLFALCPAVARRVCAACHQLCTEEKRHAHTVNSGH